MKTINNLRINVLMSFPTSRLPRELYLCGVLCFISGACDLGGKNRKNWRLDETMICNKGGGILSIPNQHVCKLLIECVLSELIKKVVEKRLS